MQTHTPKKKSVPQADNLQRKKQINAKADPVQRMPDLEEEDLLQGKFAKAFGDPAQRQAIDPISPIQRMEGLEEEDLLQGKFDPVQRMEGLEEEDLLQGKFDPVQRMEGLEEEDLLQGKFDPVQRMEGLEEEDLLQGKFQPVQRKENNTGLPDNLKSGIENLSGYSMDDVKVHYNSDQPTQLNAHAYAQGTDIHIAPGQEQHLPHEAWHVVQQKQGRVRPTRQLKGKVNVNDDVGLEREADVMGQRSLQAVQRKEDTTQLQTRSQSAQTVQLAGKKPSRLKIASLVIESIGHLALGVLGVMAGAGAITSVALAPLGVVGIIGGVGQMVVGISKIIRASVMGYSRSHGGLSEGQQKFLAVLTGVEGAITLATAVTGAATVGVVLKIVMGSISAFSSLIKVIRGFGSIWAPFRQKVAKWLVPLESIIGGVSAIGGALQSVGAGIMGAVGYVVNLVKSIRAGGDIGDDLGEKDAQQAPRRIPPGGEVVSGEEEMPTGTPSDLIRQPTSPLGATEESSLLSSSN